MEKINATGRRKEAVARVYITKGKGNITINNCKIEDYFSVPNCRHIIKQPLEVLSLTDKYDIKVNLAGGGITGQAEALRLGISRALIKIDPEYRATLKPLGLLTRDSRVIERKKPGQPKARKKFQFSKR